MSDYTSTYTENTGDTIDVSDFSNEFDAIETAVATKADVDSDTLTNLTIGSGFLGGAEVEGTLAATTSGTDVTITGIPSWAKTVTITMSGISTDSTNGFSLLLGDSGGIETSGYLGGSSKITSTPAFYSSASEFIIAQGVTAGVAYYGTVTLNIHDSANNIWAMSGSVTNGTNASYCISGVKALSLALSQVRLSGISTDNFDAGAFNVLYSG